MNNNELETKKRQRDATYFHYYSLLTHQQNMLQDMVRTSTYQKAILQNPQIYLNKTVMDVGAGSGILSYFAVKAGAKVIAVEASNMALKLQKMIYSASQQHGIEAKNNWLDGNIKVINSKIEEVELPPNCIDTIISEPIGVFIVHERMVESFLYARDNFLKPGGTMVPSQASLYLAPFTDTNLWGDTKLKTRFWEQSDFYGVDLTPLKQDAVDEQFSMPVIGYFDPQCLLLLPMEGYPMDFTTITMEQLKQFEIPIHWKFEYTGIIHGIASWFDLHFNVENGNNFTMSTSPHSERTHWQQLRLLLKEPIAVNIGQSLQGSLKFEVNNMRSYNIEANITLYSKDNMPILKHQFIWYLHEQTYNYNYLGPSLELKPEQLGFYESNN
ncbi:S-adenosyl-L-methionine-dependent methyltransferase [Neoconidiobolus thromboides FSU 785]|nr:S-adenosyl-L-methionine-dependent methyltransferase [Neoconidiobolus thromboides FSU 785]